MWEGMRSGVLQDEEDAHIHIKNHILRQTPCPPLVYLHSLSSPVKPAVDFMDDYTRLHHDQGWQQAAELTDNKQVFK